MSASPDTCRLTVVPACQWSHHGYKHFPYEGMRREDTRRGPARYLVGFDARSIQALERETVSGSDTAGARGLKRMYMRNIGEVIGWDGGMDARFSFVECSGGQVAGRAFHGRPMSDPTIKRVFDDVGRSES